MIQSMTGFGKATAELPTKKITIEIKSLNSKQIDILTRIPGVYREKEMDIRTLLSRRLERGKVEFIITTEDIGEAQSVKISPSFVESYKKQIEGLSNSLNIPSPTDWFATLLRLPDVIQTEMNEINQEEWAIVHNTIETAMTMLCDFRAQEGNMLHKLLEKNIRNISGLLKEIEPYEKERIDKIKTRITENIQKIPEVQVDHNRLEQELIFYIERLDINEEKHRLENHLKYFTETLNSEKGQGKKLGFIAQEIGREINTLGSKSNHAEMQKVVVLMKDELEQIKEQILNIL